MSHRGSILCLPQGIWASAVEAAGEVDLAAVSLALADDAGIDHFLVGTGREMVLCRRPCATRSATAASCSKP